MTGGRLLRFVAIYRSSEVKALIANRCQVTLVVGTLFKQTQPIQQLIGA